MAGKHVRRTRYTLGLVKNNRVQVVGKPLSLVKYFFSHKLWEVGVSLTLVRVVADPPASGSCVHSDGGLVVA